MVAFTLNGEARTLDADPEMPLLWAIRDIIGLTGTKFGCGLAQCGACTVHIDGVPTRSCQTAVGDVEGMSITTIEGLSGKVGETVQTVWAELDVPQCGYCQSGQIMSAAALLTETPKPTDARHRLRDERQSLPLRNLSTHPRGDPRSRAPTGGMTMLPHRIELTTARPSRRQFLDRRRVDRRTCRRLPAGRGRSGKRASRGVSRPIRSRPMSKSRRKTGS